MTPATMGRAEKPPAGKGMTVKFCVIQAQPRGCLFIRSAGRFNAQHMKAMIQAISNLDAYRDIEILHDMRLVDFDVAVEQVIEVARSYPSGERAGKLAVVAESVLGYGMLRVIVSIRENVNRTVSAFRSIEEAIDWLNVPGLQRKIPDQVEAVLSEHAGSGGSDPDGFGIVMKRLREPVD